MRFSISGWSSFPFQFLLIAGMMVTVTAASATAQEERFDDDAPAAILKPGDKVELRSGQQGTVISVDGAKVNVLLTVPAVDLVIPGQPRPRTVDPRPADLRGTDPRPGFDNPDSPRPLGGQPAGEKQPPWVGTWLSTDRAVVMKNATEFRVFWTDPNGTVRIDDGKYTLEGDVNTGETFYYASGENVYPWKLNALEEKKMVMSHDEVGTRTFQRVTPNTGNPLVGSYNARYSTDQGASGTAKVYLYSDGMWVIDEYDQAGKLKVREYGSWTGDLEKGTLSITFPYENKLHTVPGRIRDTGPTSFIYYFRALDGSNYTYNCERRTTQRSTGGQSSRGFGNGGFREGGERGNFGNGGFGNGGFGNGGFGNGGQFPSRRP